MIILQRSKVGGLDAPYMQTSTVSAVVFNVAIWGEIYIRIPHPSSTRHAIGFRAIIRSVQDRVLRCRHIKASRAQCGYPSLQEGLRSRLPYPFAFFTSSISAGTMSKQFPTMAQSAISK